MDDLDLNQWLWILVGALFLLGVAAMIAGHGRNKRRDIDRPGWVPWQMVEILSFFLAFAAAVLAMKL